jgi:hypothetical protein
MTIFTSDISALTLAIRQAESPVLARLVSLNTDDETLADYCEAKLNQLGDESEIRFEEFCTLVYQSTSTDGGGFRFEDSPFTLDFEDEFKVIIDHDYWRGEIVRGLLCDPEVLSEDFSDFHLDGLVDVYTSRLTAWLASDSSRCETVHEVYDDYEPESLSQALMIAQGREIYEIAAELRAWLLEVWGDFQKNSEADSFLSQAVIY